MSHWILTGNTARYKTLLKKKSKHILKGLFHLGSALPVRPVFCFISAKNLPPMRHRLCQLTSHATQMLGWTWDETTTKLPHPPKLLKPPPSLRWQRAHLRNQSVLSVSELSAYCQLSVWLNLLSSEFTAHLQAMRQPKCWESARPPPCLKHLKKV